MSSEQNNRTEESVHRMVESGVNKSTNDKSSNSKNSSKNECSGKWVI